MELSESSVRKIKKMKVPGDAATSKGAVGELGFQPCQGGGIGDRGPLRHISRLHGTCVSWAWNNHEVVGCIKGGINDTAPGPRREVVWRSARPRKEEAEGKVPWWRGRNDFMLGKGTWELLGRIYSTVRVGRIKQVQLPSVTWFRECRQQRFIGWDRDYWFIPFYTRVGASERVRAVLSVTDSPQDRWASCCF